MWFKPEAVDDACLCELDHVRAEDFEGAFKRVDVAGENVGQPTGQKGDRSDRRLGELHQQIDAGTGRCSGGRCGCWEEELGRTVQVVELESVEQSAFLLADVLAADSA